MDSAGNKVFRAQMVNKGPIAISNTISAAIAMNFTVKLTSRHPSSQ
jgi:hypothetical protein